MKLEYFSVSRFRSIKESEKISFSDLTIIIGKNNEGKSNIIRALQISLAILQRAPSGTWVRMSDRAGGYDWAMDFPQSLTQSKSIKNSAFKVSFTLSDSECLEFKREVGSSLNGNLTFEIKIGDANQPDVKVVKSGPHADAFKKKSQNILKFLRERMDFTSISAIRTGEDLLEVIHRQLKEVEASIKMRPDYREALEKINKIRSEEFNLIAKTLLAPLKNFIPGIRGIEITTSDERRYPTGRSNFDLLIDDGANTSIEQKGDGIKSLAAIALLNEIRPIRSTNIVAIEEPEAHLHAGAIHDLKSILQKLSVTRQVIISTHNPIFVNRAEIGSNIIVSSGRARPARSVGEIRDTLGVRVADSLHAAESVLIVEGESDVRIVKKFLLSQYPEINRKLSSGELVIDSLNGASKLSARLEHYRQTVCKTFVLLDDDEEGRSSYARAEAHGLADSSSTIQTKCHGMKDAELEDCINPDVYCKQFQDRFNFELTGRAFRNNKKKWSIRVEDSFRENSRPYSDRIAIEIKTLVADATDLALSSTPQAVTEFVKFSALKNLANLLCSGLDLRQ